jgi:radical SAM superfamily enzyme YgiQ (UPF0313 family)/GT2 family glycosyltransferase
MKTLIISLAPYNARGMDTWHDHGAGLTYTAAKNAGCDVEFLDMRTLKTGQELIEQVEKSDMVALSIKSSYWPIADSIISLAKQLKKQVVVGGYHVTSCQKDLLNDDRIDYVFQGESEITFPKLLQDGFGLKRSIIGEKVNNLDDLPWIDRKIFAYSVEDCSGWWHGGRNRRMVSVVAARGCPYQCSFCQPLEFNHFGKKLRRRSVDSLISEILWLRSKYNPDCLMIHDDTFFLQDSWLEEFASKYSQVKLPFWASARADGICRNPTLFSKLVGVGWDLVSVGFESGSQRMLDIMKKGTKVSENLESAKIIKSSGAHIYANYILGLPWEHKEDIQLTAKMVDQIDAEMVCWSYFAPYPGNDLGEECIKNGWSLLGKNDYDRYADGKKCKHVDYDYLNRVVGGFREVRPPLSADIIIPTYENEELTLACLQSIKDHTDSNIYRVILVDNGSKDTTKVESALSEIPSIFLKLPTNQGFVKAINTGLKHSTAPAICLLNNDTIVTTNWLDKLLTSLYSLDEIGVVGPMTMFARMNYDSQHCLSLYSALLPPHACWWSLEKVNEELSRLHSGKLQDMEFIAFFCAIIKQEVYNKVVKSNKRYKNGLDENFNIGLWDDVDWCTTVRELGYRTVLSLDTCIYHKGRSTFSLLEKNGNLDINSLLKTNREYLDKHHNIEPFNVPRGLQNKTFMRML